VLEASGSLVLDQSGPAEKTREFSTNLDSVIGGFNLVRAPEEGKPGSGRNSAESSEQLIKLLEYPILSTQVHSL
jgi:hypothetical protein